LPSLKLRCKSALLRIRYGDEYTPTHRVYWKQKLKVVLAAIIFIEWVSQDGEPLKLNGAFHINLSILQFVAASAAKADLGALFHKCQTGIIFWIILEDLGTA
jgi:hypothetical protein